MAPGRRGLATQEIAFHAHHNSRQHLHQPVALLARSPARPRFFKPLNLRPIAQATVTTGYK